MAKRSGCVSAAPPKKGRSGGCGPRTALCRFLLAFFFRPVFPPSLSLPAGIYWRTPRNNRTGELWSGKDLTGAREDAVDHIHGKSACESILLTGMVTAEQRERSDDRLGGMSETRKWSWHRGDLRHGARQPVPGESAEADDTANLQQCLQLAHEKGTASIAFIRSWFVGRRTAADARGDVTIVELQSIIAANRGGLVGEAGTMKRREKPVTGAITGKHSACAVAPVCRRRQPDDEQPSLRVPKAGHRFTPVGLIAIGGALVARNLLTPGNQPWTRRASDDFGLQLRQAELFPSAMEKILVSAVPDGATAVSAVPDGTLVSAVPDVATAVSAVSDGPAVAQGVPLSELEKQSRRRAARRKPAVCVLPRRAYAAPLAPPFLLTLSRLTQPCHDAGTVPLDGRVVNHAVLRNQGGGGGSGTGAPPGRPPAARARDWARPRRGLHRPTRWPRPLPVTTIPVPAGTAATAQRIAANAADSVPTEASSPMCRSGSLTARSWLIPDRPGGVPASVSSSWLLSPSDALARTGDPPLQGCRLFLSPIVSSIDEGQGGIYWICWRNRAG